MIFSFACQASCGPVCGRWVEKQGVPFYEKWGGRISQVQWPIFSHQGGRQDSHPKLQPALHRQSCSDSAGNPSPKDFYPELFLKPLTVSLSLSEGHTDESAYPKSPPKLPEWKSEAKAQDTSENPGNSSWGVMLQGLIQLKLYVMAQSPDLKNKVAVWERTPNEFSRQ